MPAISKVRFTNIVYEDGNKRYNDETFIFDGENAAIILENGGGKTVFIQTALQAIIPHTNMASRKMKETLVLDEPAHVAIEWIISDRPRRYALTAVTLFRGQDALDSFRFVTEYAEGSTNTIEHLPFTREVTSGVRTAEKGEILDYYRNEQAKQKGITFDTITGFRQYIENNYQIIAKEWESIVQINSAEGDIEKFFEECMSSQQLFEKLLIPRVEHTMYFDQEENFVDSFTARREGFKIHRRMSETIREHELIRGQLTAYENHFSSMHEKDLAFTKVKEWAKASAIYYDRLYQKRIEKRVENDERLQEAQAELTNHEKRKMAYEVRVLEEEMLLEKEQAAHTLAEKALVDTRYKALREQILSLKVAGEQTTIEQAIARIEVKQEELANLAEQRDDEELQLEKDENLRELKGYFLTLEARLDRDMDMLRMEEESILKQLLSEQESESTLQQEVQKLQEQAIKKETEIKSFEAQQQTILQSLYTKQDNETVALLKKRLEQETTEIDEKIVSAETTVKRLKDDVKAAKAQKLSLFENQNETKTSLALKRNEAEQMETAHETTIAQLQQMDEKWRVLTDIYRQEQSIRNSIQNDIERFTQLKNDKMRSERLALRYVDDYTEMNQFFADPFIDEQIHTWQNQFRYLEKGTKYLTQLTISGKEDPYWPITLITTTEEVPKLIEKVTLLRKKMQYPLRILSIDEVQAYIQGETSQTEEMIMPLHWDYYKEVDQFNEWKTSLREEAHRITIERIKAEAKINEWQAIQQTFSQFLTRYPQVDVFRVNEEIRSLSEALKKVENALENCIHFIEENNNQIDILQVQIKKDYDLLIELRAQLTLTHESERLAKRINEKKNEAYSINGARQKQRRILNHIQLALEQTQLEVEEVKERVRILRSSKFDQLDRDPLYMTSKEMIRPIYTDKNIEFLRETYESVQRKLANQSSERQVIELDIEQQKKVLERAQAEIEQLLVEGGEVTPVVILPLDFRKKIKSLTKEAHELKSVLNEHESLAQTANDALIKARTLYEEQLARYENKYGKEIVSFTDLLIRVKDSLAKEAALLSERLKTLVDEEKRMTKEIKETEEAVQFYRFLDGKFGISHPKVTVALLTEEEQLALTYQAMAQRNKIEQALTEAKKAFEEMTVRVEKEKDKFTHFCHQSIQDSKLREHTIQGLNVHKTFEEIQQFSSHMLTRIANAIQISETTMKEKDKELAQFIHRMYTHIAKVVDELKSIPRRTRVKTVNGSREIYKFDIPEWQENEAKEAIRAYVERLGQRVEHNDFKDPSGKENTTQIKEEIQKTLNTQQLLNVIVGHKKLKASCRKVTNDLSVSPRYFSWEQSNKWSGGEKWSKNMTLFLGVLKYIAEKNQDQRLINSKKRSRTVIVDNPFGKASSDHVLQPVFYIAEQLGFQMIALTAHAEGKFLSDYFPVIYSCRLRQAAHSSKQIVEATKEIQKAFFEDHDPETLSRLGEQEQLWFNL